MVFSKSKVRIFRNLGLLLMLWSSSLTLQAACPGDTDWNGMVDLGDLVRFMHYYHDADPLVRQLADTNQDGKTNVSDISVIFDDYQYGCRSELNSCPGDTNWNDRIEVDDLIRFFHYCQSRDSIVRMAADVNQDDRTNIIDIVTIFDLYSSGCR